MLKYNQCKVKNLLHCLPHQFSLFVIPYHATASKLCANCQRKWSASMPVSLLSFALLRMCLFRVLFLFCAPIAFNERKGLPGSCLYPSGRNLRPQSANASSKLNFIQWGASHLMGGNSSSCEKSTYTSRTRTGTL